MGCKKQREVRNGNEVKLYCTNRSCSKFGQLVTVDYCNQICALTVVDLRTHRNNERSEDAKYPEPKFEGDVLLCNYTPNGFVETEPGKQKSSYPACDSLSRQATLTKEGKLKFNFYCAGKPTTQIDCERCQAGETPRFLKQIKNYAHAISAWVPQDMPKRTDEEVFAILNNQCSPCEHYDKARGRCNVCGCRLNTSSTAVANKIRMATEHCPKGKW